MSSLPVGLVIGPYEILAPLGVGGMGEVYRARDHRLRRDVALKVLGPAFSGDRELLERFRREALLLAAVTHPNVCQIFDLGEHEGVPYLTMELLSGQSLADRIAARGPLPPAEALEVAGEILAALSELHGRGIVHRDLKPSNVFLTTHGTKLLDLGVARQIGTGEEDVNLTRPGIAVGTPRYMAPEQWTGAADPSSDLFSCAVVLYEMITGRAAFPGDTPLRIMQNTMAGATPTLSRITPPALQLVLRKALAARPEDRFRSAEEMAAALSSATAGVPIGIAVIAPKRLLVLPFRLLRPDPDIEFLRLALADAIVSSLAGLRHLVVRSSRGSGDADEDPARLASAAGVDAILYGTLMRSGDRVRVSTQLVDGTDGQVRASSRAEASMRDLFELQDDLAHQVVEALKVPLAPGEGVTSNGGRAPEPRAYELYLRAVGAPLSTSRSNSLQVARDLLRESVSADPELAPAWAALGRIHRLLAKYGHADRELSLREARRAFETALALAPDSPQVHNLYTHFEIEELASPVPAMLRLLGQITNRRTNAELYAGLVTACRYTGLFDSSLAAHRRARELDPQISTSVAFTHWARGDYASAAASDTEQVPFARQYALPMLGRTDEAIAGYLEWKERHPGGLEVIMSQTMIAALRGDREACEEAAARVDASGFGDAEGLYFQARALALVGSKEAALITLDRVIGSGYTCPVTLAQDPWLDRLRRSSRFEALCEHALEAHQHAADSFVRAGGHAVLGLDNAPTAMV